MPACCDKFPPLLGLRFCSHAKDAVSWRMRNATVRERGVAATVGGGGGGETLFTRIVNPGGGGGGGSVFKFYYEG